MRSFLRFGALFAVGVIAAYYGIACGQSYPTKPVRIITSLPGGVTDFTARLVAHELSGSLGQQVIVDNRGSGILTAEIVMKAPPDGYTLLVSGNSLWIGPLFRKTSYDPIKDFTPISFLVNSPNVLVVHPSLPVKSVADLVVFTKARPGQLNYGSSGTGGAMHLASELFKSMTKLNIVHIPYKGAGAAISNVIGGDVQIAFAIAGSATAHIASGKLRGLAVTSTKPSALLPGLPTVAAVVPGYRTGSETVFLAPPGMPAAIVSRLHRDVVRALGQADTREKVLAVSAEVVASSPEDLGAMLRSEMETWARVINEAGLRLE